MFRGRKRKLPSFFVPQILNHGSDSESDGDPVLGQRVRHMHAVPGENQVREVRDHQRGQQIAAVEEQLRETILRPELQQEQLRQLRQQQLRHQELLHQLQAQRLQPAFQQQRRLGEVDQQEEV